MKANENFVAKLLVYSDKGIITFTNFETTNKYGFQNNANRLINYLKKAFTPHAYRAAYIFDSTMYPKIKLKNHTEVAFRYGEQEIITLRYKLKTEGLTPEQSQRLNTLMNIQKLVA